MRGRTEPPVVHAQEVKDRHCGHPVFGGDVGDLLVAIADAAACTALLGDNGALIKAGVRDEERVCPVAVAAYPARMRAADLRHNRELTAAGRADKSGECSGPAMEVIPAAPQFVKNRLTHATLPGRHRVFEAVPYCWEDIPRVSLTEANQDVGVERKFHVCSLAR